MSGDKPARVAPLWLLLAVLVGLMVACLGFFAWAAVDKWQTNAVEEEVAAESEERAELQRVAQEFVKEFHTYGPDDLEDNQLVGYEDRVSPLMTAKFQAAFQEGLRINAAAVAQLSTRSAGDATAAGVASFEDDTADVLVGGWVHLAYQHPEDPDQDVVGDRQSVRYRVVMRQIEGEWLVDRLCNVDQSARDTQCLGDEAVTEPPAEVPTEGATDESPSPSPTDDETESGEGGSGPAEDQATEGEQ